MTAIKCKVCGEPESAHHDFEPKMPEWCVCDYGVWGDHVSDVCADYQGDGNQYCRKCEHDRECHK